MRGMQKKPERRTDAAQVDQMIASGHEGEIKRIRNDV